MTIFPLQALDGVWSGIRADVWLYMAVAGWRYQMYHNGIMLAYIYVECKCVLIVCLYTFLETFFYWKTHLISEII